MFELKNQDAKLMDINPRTEKAGNENRLAADLHFRISISNDILSEFDPMLKSAMYKKGYEIQGELIDDPNYLPALKFERIGVINWQLELHNFDFTLHHGIGKSDIILQDCIVDKFKFALLDGGTVVLGFRIAAHPTSAQLGQLCEFINDEIEISVIHDGTIIQKTDLLGD